ncbi:phosphatidylglycerophosphatase A [Acinetobacter nectaris]|uniref:phosphatidylglycerophosphatase A family protein n=1 Tax=Acinetobacter nectaris TaxID=1219382 RepID=UPI001F36764D|nr:phosphatidylglycerophosphatase A [Acinetobacter nectaris]MCF8998339.1 phosphatidylglycerophosphatase A [Acinetobacter nectaris]MCF9027809.1 phosphatidylglycerophosphatase A [Acinetobacter nectaris]
MGINILPKPKIHFKQFSLYQRFIIFLAVGLGSGLAPKAPGTFGSAFALLFIPLFLISGFYGTLAITIIMSIIGIYICGKAATLIKVHDDSRIVWDEFAGQSITFLPLIYFNEMNIQWALIGFALFRLFDIWKPWPIHIIDTKVDGGFGIMLDDIIAGLWAAICILIYLLFSV